MQDELRRAYAPTPIQQPIVETDTPENNSIAGNGAAAPRVFISYSHRDQEFVLALVEQLKRRGIHVWIDQVELVVGDSLITRIGAAIHEGDFVVPFPASSPSRTGRRRSRRAPRRRTHRPARRHPLPLRPQSAL